MATEEQEFSNPLAPDQSKQEAQDDTITKYEPSFTWLIHV